MTMKAKPAYFLGSSSEHARVATQLKKALEKELDVAVTVWDDALNVFRLGRNVMESILTVPHFFDYSVVLLGADDLVKSRNKRQMAPRDNTIFELGAFLGGQGRRRAFAIVLEPYVASGGKRKDRIKIPSDYGGEQYIQLELSRNGLAKPGSLKIAVERLAQANQEHRNLSFLSPLPSTVLAITYYKNFLQPLCKRLIKGTVHIADTGQTLPLSADDFRVTVAIPRSLDRASRSGQELYKEKNKLSLCTVGADTRPFPFYISLKKQKGSYQFFDVPTTLRGCAEAIRILLPVDAIGKSKEQKLLESREIENFVCTLKQLVDTDIDGQHLKGRIKIVFW